MEELEEGEIVDDLEDISSDEELNMRQRIEELEAKNKELERIAQISGGLSHDIRTARIDFGKAYSHKPYGYSYFYNSHEEYTHRSRHDSSDDCSVYSFNDSVPRRHQRRTSSNRERNIKFKRLVERQLQQQNQDQEQQHHRSKSKRHKKRTSSNKHVEKNRRLAPAKDDEITSTVTLSSSESGNTKSSRIVLQEKDLSGDNSDKISTLNRKMLQLAVLHDRKSSNLNNTISFKDCLKRNVAAVADVTPQEQEDSKKETVEKEIKQHTINEDSISSEERELRIIALKSAVLNKHRERLKRNAESPYSPTDFDKKLNEGSFDTVDMIESDINEIETISTTSPVASEIPSPAFSQSSCSISAVDTKPVDMEIANTDSESDDLMCLDQNSQMLPFEQVSYPIALAPNVYPFNSSENIAMNTYGDSTEMLFQPIFPPPITHFDTFRNGSPPPPPPPFHFTITTKVQSEDCTNEKTPTLTSYFNYENEISASVKMDNSSSPMMISENRASFHNDEDGEEEVQALRALLLQEKSRKLQETNHQKNKKCDDATKIKTDPNTSTLSAVILKEAVRRLQTKPTTSNDNSSNWESKIDTQLEDSLELITIRDTCQGNERMASEPSKSPYEDISTVAENTLQELPQVNNLIIHKTNQEHSENDRKFQREKSKAKQRVLVKTRVKKIKRAALATVARQQPNAIHSKENQAIIEKCRTMVAERLNSTKNEEKPYFDLSNEKVLGNKLNVDGQNQLQSFPEEAVKETSVNQSKLLKKETVDENKKNQMPNKTSSTKSTTEHSNKKSISKQKTNTLSQDALNNILREKLLAVMQSELQSDSSAKPDHPETTPNVHLLIDEQIVETNVSTNDSEPIANKISDSLPSKETTSLQLESYPYVTEQLQTATIPAKNQEFIPGKQYSPSCAATSTTLTANLSPMLSNSKEVSNSSVEQPAIKAVKPSVHISALNSKKAALNSKPIGGMKKIVKPNKVINASSSTKRKSSEMSGGAVKKVQCIDRRNSPTTNIPIKKIIIRLGESETETSDDGMLENNPPLSVTEQPTHISLFTGIAKYYEFSKPNSVQTSGTNSRCESPHPDKSIDAGFELKLNSYLQNIRNNVQINSIPKVVKPSPSANAVQSSTPKTQTALRYLSKAHQEEYKYLLNQLGVLEKQKKMNKSVANERVRKPSESQQSIEVTRENDKSNSKDSETNTKATNEQMTKEKILQGYESSYKSLGIGLMTNLDKSLKLVEDAKKIKREKLRHEHRLKELETELEIVKKKCREASMQGSQIIPKISSVNNSINNIKQKRLRLSRMAKELGKTLKGDEYRLHNEFKYEIMRKTEKLADDIKFFNSMGTIIASANDNARVIETTENVYEHEDKNRNSNKQPQSKSASFVATENESPDISENQMSSVRADNETQIDTQNIQNEMQSKYSDLSMEMNKDNTDQGTSKNNETLNKELCHEVTVNKGEMSSEMLCESIEIVHTNPIEEKSREVEEPENPNISIPLRSGCNIKECLIDASSPTCTRIAQPKPLEQVLTQDKVEIQTSELSTNISEKDCLIDANGSCSAEAVQPMHLEQALTQDKVEIQTSDLSTNIFEGHCLIDVNGSCSAEAVQPKPLEQVVTQDEVEIQTSELNTNILERDCSNYVNSSCSEEGVQPKSLKQVFTQDKVEIQTSELSTNISEKDCLIDANGSCSAEAVQPMHLEQALTQDKVEIQTSDLSTNIFEGHCLIDVNGSCSAEAVQPKPLEQVVTQDEVEIQTSELNTNILERDCSIDVNSSCSAEAVQPKPLEQVLTQDILNSPSKTDAVQPRLHEQALTTNEIEIKTSEVCANFLEKDKVICSNVLETKKSKSTEQNVMTVIVIDTSCDEKVLLEKSETRALLNLPKELQNEVLEGESAAEKLQDCEPTTSTKQTSKRSHTKNQIDDYIALSDKEEVRALLPIETDQQQGCSASSTVCVECVTVKLLPEEPTRQWDIQEGWLNPEDTICPFELKGKCNDEECKFLHLDKC